MSRVGRATSRRAQSGPLAVIPDSRCQTAQSNSAVLFVPAARGCARVFLASRRTRFAEASASLPFAQTSGRTRAGRFQPPRRRTPPHPDEGWMERRQAHSFFRSRLRGATTLSRCDRDPSRRSTVAVSDADPRSRLPAVEPEPQRLPAPRHKAWRSGSGPPAVRFAPRVAGRHSWLRLSGSFLENAPLSQDGILVL
jgi:hypothetical protein